MKDRSVQRMNAVAMFAFGVCGGIFIGLVIRILMDMR